MAMFSLRLTILSFFVLALIQTGQSQSDDWPRNVPTVKVRCPPVVDNFFKCSPNWNYFEEEEDMNWANDTERIERIDNLVASLRKRTDIPSLDFDASNYQGSEVYNDAIAFYGIEGTNISKTEFVVFSYFLDYYASNTYVVAMRDEKAPVVGFSGGLFAPPAQEDDGSATNEPIYHSAELMDALRYATVRYKVYIDGQEDKYFYAIGYMGMLNIPYFYSPEDSERFGQFSFAYNMDYKWATQDNGTFIDFVNMIASKEDGVLPSLFMSKFMAPTYADSDKSEFQKIGSARFDYMFNNTYGLINGNENTTDNDRYTPFNKLEGNFCRSLGRNNAADADVDVPDGSGDDYYYDFEPDTNGTFECNKEKVPSYFFMTYEFNDSLPRLFSTKYELWVDGSCQYRASLDGSGYPSTTKTNVKYGQTTASDPNPEDENLPSKRTFIMNGSDFFGLHLVQDMKDSGNPSSYHPDASNTDVDNFYYYYSLNQGTSGNIYLDELSLCNTAISDNYVLYDMKDYANVYGSIEAITDASFGYESVYNSMKIYPTKTNYTAVVTTAQISIDSDTSAAKMESKTQLQKCTNVFLDTNGLDITACNDVTSTWDWGVFAVSLVGILAVIGLWVWGGLYSKNFNRQPPAYYTDLLNYKDEWERLNGVNQKKNKEDNINFSTNDEEEDVSDN